MADLSTEIIQPLLPSLLSTILERRVLTLASLLEPYSPPPQLPLDISPPSPLPPLLDPLAATSVLTSSLTHGLFLPHLPPPSSLPWPRLSLPSPPRDSLLFSLLRGAASPTALAAASLLAASQGSLLSLLTLAHSSLPSGCGSSEDIHAASSALHAAGAAAQACEAAEAAHAQATAVLEEASGLLTAAVCQLNEEGASVEEAAGEEAPLLLGAKPAAQPSPLPLHGKPPSLLATPSQSAALAAAVGGDEEGGEPAAAAAAAAPPPISFSGSPARSFIALARARHASPTLSPSLAVAAAAAAAPSPPLSAAASSSKPIPGTALDAASATLVKRASRRAAASLSTFQGALLSATQAAAATGAALAAAAQRKAAALEAAAAACARLTGSPFLTVPGAAAWLTGLQSSSRGSTLTPPSTLTSPPATTSSSNQVWACGQNSHGELGCEGWGASPPPQAPGLPSLAL